MNKKAIGPVVATALLIVVAVVALVGFQNWYGLYSSQLFSNTEIQSQQTSSSSEIETIVGDKLYINLDNNETIQSIQIDGIDCEISGNYSGITDFDVSSCVAKTNSKTPEIVVVTGYEVISKQIYLKDGFRIEDPEDDGFYLGENGVTVFCPDVEVGASGLVNGINYTKRNVNQIKANNSLASTSCTSEITSMSFMFYGKSSFNEDISSWDTSLVTDMSLMFVGNNLFNQDISNWDVSSVKNMYKLFFYAKAFNQDISNWDTSSVTSMLCMFTSAISFNQDISNWDTSSVTDMFDMFNSAISFNQDISGWDTSKVERMSYTFYNATSFNQDLSSWDVSSVTSCSNFSNLADAWSLNKPNLPASCLS